MSRFIISLQVFISFRSAVLSSSGGFPQNSTSYNDITMVCRTWNPNQVSMLSKKRSARKIIRLCKFTVNGSDLWKFMENETHDKILWPKHCVAAPKKFNFFQCDLRKLKVLTPLTQTFESMALDVWFTRMW